MISTTKLVVASSYRCNLAVSVGDLISTSKACLPGLLPSLGSENLLLETNSKASPNRGYRGYRGGIALNQEQFPTVEKTAVPPRSWYRPRTATLARRVTFLSLFLLSHLDFDLAVPSPPTSCCNAKTCGLHWIAWDRRNVFVSRYYAEKSRQQQEQQGASAASASAAASAAAASAATAAGGGARKGGVYNHGMDDENFDYIVHEGEVFQGRYAVKATIGKGG